MGDGETAVGARNLFPKHTRSIRKLSVLAAQYHDSDVCNETIYIEAVRKIGFTIASILAAISSAGMRLGV